MIDMGKRMMANVSFLVEMGDHELPFCMGTITKSKGKIEIPKPTEAARVQGIVEPNLVHVTVFQEVTKSDMPDFKMGEVLVRLRFWGTQQTHLGQIENLFFGVRFVASGETIDFPKVTDEDRAQGVMGVNSIDITIFQEVKE